MARSYEDREEERKKRRAECWVGEVRMMER